MKCLVVLLAVVAVSAAQFRNNLKARAAPKYNQQPQDGNVQFDINPDGSFKYSYQTDTGIAAEQTGTAKNFGGNPPVVPVVVEGYYAYTSPEGVPVSVGYTADENGYRPSSDILPVGPPVPPAIQRALEYIERQSRQIKK